jgi:4-hydroxy-tetrahydrodipicolinate synthase
VAESSNLAAIQYVRDVQELGASGVMLLPPMSYKGDPRETITYFRAVAAGSDLPIMIYNNPISYANDITPAMFAELADEPRFVALKESSGDPRRITELHNAVGDRYALFTGVDDLLLECSILGIDGWVAGSGIAFPHENQRLWILTRAGRWDQARDLYRWFQPLLKLDTHVHFVQYIKLCEQEVGLGAEWVRAPRLPITGEERKRVLQTIRAAIQNRPQLPED